MDDRGLAQGGHMSGNTYARILRPKSPKPGHPFLQLNDLGCQGRLQIHRGTVAKQPQLHLPYHSNLPPVHLPLPGPDLGGATIARRRPGESLRFSAEAIS